VAAAGEAAGPPPAPGAPAAQAAGEPAAGAQAAPAAAEAPPAAAPPARLAGPSPRHVNLVLQALEGLGIRDHQLIGRLLATLQASLRAPPPLAHPSTPMEQAEEPDSGPATVGAAEAGGASWGPGKLVGGSRGWGGGGDGSGSGSSSSSSSKAAEAAGFTPLVATNMLCTLASLQHHDLGAAQWLAGHALKVGPYKVPASLSCLYQAVDKA